MQVLLAFCMVGGRAEDVGYAGAGLLMKSSLENGHTPSLQPTGALCGCRTYVFN